VHNDEGKDELGTTKRDDKLDSVGKATVYSNAYKGKVNVSGRDVANKVGNKAQEKG
jgi:hypothetical protein